MGAGITAALTLLDHNTRDPRIRWRHATGDKVRSSPTVVDKVVHIGSCDKHVYALNASAEESSA